VFCGYRCRIHDLFAGQISKIGSAARSPLPTIWVAIVVGLAVLLVGSWITTLALRLQSVNQRIEAERAPLPYAVAELTRDGETLTIAILGSPNATVLLIADGVPARVVTLDEKGRGTVADAGFAEGVVLEIAALAEAPDTVPGVPTLTPTATGTVGATGTPTPTRTHARSSTRPQAAPTRTATPPSVANHEAASGPRRRPTPTEPAEQRPSTETGSGIDRPSVSPPVLHLVTDAGAKIAVTFDGNASSNGTSELLELLHELDLKITLFVTGGFVERYPTLVRQAVLAGHEVGNHTFSHPHLTTYADNRRHRLLPTVTKKGFQDQLRRTEAAFREATGRPMAPLWRAPYGEENSTLRGWALEIGYLHVRWSSLKGASLDSLDWIADEHSKLYRDSETMVDRLLRFPRLEGGIVLMHLATERSEPPWSDLPRFVAELKKRDVRPVKVSELLAESKTWRPWLEKARKRHDELNP
jgi:peptidoglycan/xylan/chitin deacetylase (PgdA/CDA1 family)